MLNLFRKKADASPVAAPASPPAVRRPVALPAPTTAQATTADLTARRGAFEDKQRAVHATMQSLGKQALERRRMGDTQGALAFLRRRKLQEALDRRLNAMIANVDTMIAAVDDSGINAELLGAAQVGNAHLQRAQARVNAEAVDDERDKFADIMDRQREMNDVIGQVWDPTMDVDEVDAMRELDALGEEFVESPAAAARPAAARVAGAGTQSAFAVPPSFAVPPAARPAGTARALPRSMGAELAERGS